MDERIEVKFRKLPTGQYRARVIVNGEFYAGVDGPDREAVATEAAHYATQIEFDEWGNW